jgi:hypothetical protein
MGVEWEDVLSVLMNGTRIKLNFRWKKFILKDVNYFRELGELLSKFEMKDISKFQYSIISLK